MNKEIKNLYLMFEDGDGDGGHDFDLDGINGDGSNDYGINGQDPN